LITTPLAGQIEDRVVGESGISEVEGLGVADGG
jgi:hypothetical protein